MGRQTVCCKGVVYATDCTCCAVAFISAPIDIAVPCFKLGVARVPDKSIVLFVNPRQAVIEVGNSIRRTGAELNIKRQVVFVGIVEVHITALAVEFVVQIGRLVELVIRGLDIASVVAADLQEPAYVIVEIGKHSVAVLGIACEVAVGIVSPIELRSSIVRPRGLPVKGIVVVTDCELVSVLLLCQQTVVRLIGVRDERLRADLDLGVIAPFVIDKVVGGAARCRLKAVACGVKKSR